MTETASVEKIDPKAVIKQVEFYFSDENLPTDKFLFKATQKNNGWVPISTIAMFKRMTKFRPLEDVVAALKESEKLEVSEDNELVRRKQRLQEPKKEHRADAMARSIYVKGFGDEEEASQEDIEKFFETYGPVKQVRMRRDDAKKFKGSVFVEFTSLEDAEKFIALDPKPKFNDKDLDPIMKKQEYVEMKAKEKGIDLAAQEEQQRANRGKRKFNAFKDKSFKQNNQNKRRKPNHDSRKADGAQEDSGKPEEAKETVEAAAE